MEHQAGPGPVVPGFPAVPGLVTLPGQDGAADPVARPSPGPVGEAGSGLSAGELQAIGALVAGSISASTARAYAGDWARWQAWCQARGNPARPVDPLLVAAYLQEAFAARSPGGERAYAPATLTRWVASLNRAARAAGESEPGRSPVVAAVLAGARRTSARTERRRDPLLLADLTTIADLLAKEAETGTRGVAVAAMRDLAVLTVGFFGGFRRSELAALTLRDVTWHGAGEGLRVRVARSKTDPDGTARLVKAIPPRGPRVVCPVCAVLAWARIVTAWDTQGRVGVIRTLHTRIPSGEGGHTCTSITAGDVRGLLPVSEAPVFRSLHRSGTLRGPLAGAAVNQLIRRRAAQAGLDPARLGGHSLRAGLVTEAYRAGATPEAIAQQTGHTSLRVLASYRREHAPLTGNAVLTVGEAVPPARVEDAAADGDDGSGLDGDRAVP